MTRYIYRVYIPKKNIISFASNIWVKYSDGSYGDALFSSYRVASNIIKKYGGKFIYLEFEPEKDGSKSICVLKFFENEQKMLKDENG